ncbi:MAG: flagellar export chaperone FliS [Bryobacteraceae bacterium]|nr:flagellar export chaperone FliS [Bryobacteraceae bacterium]
MTANPYGDHLAERVLGADPVELIVILYEELLASLGEARRHLAVGDAQARARSVTRAFEILAELAQSLKPEGGAELAQRLLALYDFLFERIRQGNFEQQDQPLAEAEQVVRTLLEGWRAVARQRYEPARAFDPAVLAAEPPAIHLCG